MGMYVVNTDILNIRSSPSADSDDNYVGFLRKGEKIWLEDNTVTGTIPADSSSNQWRIYGANYVLGEWVRPATYGARKMEFIQKESLSYLHNRSDNEEDWKVSWGFVDLEIWKLWDRYGSRGNGVTVAVVDSGFNGDISAFAGKKNIKYYNAVTTSQTPEECRDDTDHGTNCAGLIAAANSYYGICPDVNLIVVKIIDAAGETTPGYLLNAFNALLKEKDLKPDIVSLSNDVRTYFQGQPIMENQRLDPKTTVGDLHNIIKQMNNAGIIIVAAAGNIHDVLTNTIPSAFPECISVGGYSQSFLRSSQSTLSDFLDLVAPGEQLKLLTKSDSGTSYATPLVAGSIALIKSILKQMGKPISNAELRTALISTANVKNIVNYNTKEHGNGMIDPAAAISLLLNK